MRPSPFLTALLLIGACKDEPDPGSDLDTVRFQVLSTWEQVDLEPVGTATVALDDADGVRIEADADADGFVEVQLDWEAGPYDLTVDPGADRMGLRSLLGLTRETMPEVVTVEAWAPVIEPVGITGSISNRTAGLDLIVTAHWDGGGASWQGPGDAYHLQVPADTPFRLVVAEYRFTQDGTDQPYTQPLSNWHRLDHEGVSEHTDVSLVLDAPRAAGTGSVTVDVPDDALRGTEAWVYAMVYSSSSRFTHTCGWASGGEPTADHASWDIDVDWLAPADGEELGTVVFAETWSEASVAYRQGTPDTWTEGVSLLPVPALAKGVSTLNDAFVFEAFDSELRAEVYVSDASFNPVWSVFGAPGATLVELPEPPSSVDPGWLDGRTLQVSPALYDGPEPGTSPWYRQSYLAATPISLD